MHICDSQTGSLVFLPVHCVCLVAEFELSASMNSQCVLRVPNFCSVGNQPLKKLMISALSKTLKSMLTPFLSNVTLNQMLFSLSKILTKRMGEGVPSIVSLFLF